MMGTKIENEIGYKVILNNSRKEQLKIKAVHTHTPI